MDPRRYRAGESIEDFCRACKTDRMHTVVAADGDGRPIRVDCGYCHSEHNYRGGARIGVTGGSGGPERPALHSDARSTAHSGVHSSGRPDNRRAGLSGLRSAEPSFGQARPSAGGAEAAGPRARATSGRDPFPIVSERERTGPPMTPDREADLELLLRRVIREEAGITPVAPAEKWRGGTLVLRPGTAGLQDKSWPIETFFHKVVMLRNRLRTLEQHVNSAELSDDLKVKLQGYISGCYGTLTSFNVLFADEEDQFKGAGGD
jgi:hypothetical protein